VLLNLY